MAVDASQVSQLDAEPGELPPTMAAWVIREERFGEPVDAFQLEELEAPDPGASEVGGRVGAGPSWGRGAGEGGGGDLKQRLGRARRAGVGVPLPPGGPSHRRLGCVG